MKGYLLGLLWFIWWTVMCAVIEFLNGLDRLGK